MSFLKTLFSGSETTTDKVETKSFDWRSIFQRNLTECKESEFSDSKAILMFNAVDVAYKAIDLLSSNFANVNLVVKEVDSSGNMKAVGPSHPLQELLNNPNQLQRSSAFMYSTCAWRIINGNSYNMLLTEGNNIYSEPVYIYSLPSNAVSLNSSPPYKYTITTDSEIIVPRNGRHFDFNQATGESNIINWRSFNTNSMIRGRSTLEPMNTNVNIYNNANKWNETFFRNGCSPSLAFMIDPESEMDEDAIREFENKMHDRFTGKGNNSKPIVLKDIKMEHASTNAKDSDFVQSLKTQEVAICRGLGVPPVLLNSGEGSTYNNQHEAKLSMWDETLIPLVNSYVEELNFMLTPRYKDNLVIVPDYASVEALRKRLLDMYGVVKDARHLSLNEKRELTGQEPVPGGDVIFVSSSELPLDVASQGLGIIDDE